MEVGWGAVGGRRGAGSRDRDCETTPAQTAPSYRQEGEDSKAQDSSAANALLLTDDVNAPGRACLQSGSLCKYVIRGHTKINLVQKAGQAGTWKLIEHWQIASSLCTFHRSRPLTFSRLN